MNPVQFICDWIADARAEIASSFRPVGRGPTQFHGLLKSASALGVHRNHLYLVLSGRRKSHSLLRRYQQLRGGQS